MHLICHYQLLLQSSWVIPHLLRHVEHIHLRVYQVLVLYCLLLWWLSLLFCTAFQFFFYPALASDDWPSCEFVHLVMRALSQGEKIKCIFCANST